jgi:hypothetical protein
MMAKEVLEGCLTLLGLNSTATLRASASFGETENQFLTERAYKIIGCLLSYEMYIG